MRFLRACLVLALFYALTVACALAFPLEDTGPRLEPGPRMLDVDPADLPLGD